MLSSKKQELIEFISKHGDFLTLKMLKDLSWCVKHEDEIQKIMGLAPCSAEDHYRIEQLLANDGQGSLFFVMRYCDTFGKTKEELSKDENNIQLFLHKYKKRK